ncbi:leucine-rich repeat protein [Ruminococcus flavefaciens]|uniref:leucine-rich repeat protein n=1 Tax=Ruminococcus flavefaciens TaxID=1265 RepID=UPI0026EF13A9|nr:leucine-rich repeat protein [Ruminococcus flavefaciens]
MKKTIAGILAFICVLSPLSGVWTPSGSSSTSIIMEASAAEAAQPGKNSSQYSYKYADTSLYTTAFSAVKGVNTWNSEDGKFTYGVYKVTVTPKSEKTAVNTEYVIGISKANENVIDVDLSEDLDIPSAVKESIESANIELAGNNVRYLAAKTFNNSYLKTIKLDGVEYIDSSAFGSCKYITDIEIPASVKYVGSSVFSASGLKTLSVQNEMPVIPAELCKGTPLTKITFAHPDMIHTIGKAAFMNSSISAPICSTEYLTDTTGYEYLKVGESAYENCTQIKEVPMTDNVVSLGLYSFRGCSSITSIKCGKNLTGMDKESFRSCTSLNTIDFNKENKVLIGIGGGCFQGCTSLKNVSGIPETIGDWVYTDAKKTVGYGLGDGVFSGCTSLESCTLPQAITIIPKNTFNGCTAFTTIKFNTGNGDNIRTIGNSAFNKCTSLLSAKFDMATIIEPSAYAGCTKLVTADFPAAVYIGGTEDIDDVGNIKSSDLDVSAKKIKSGGSSFSGCTALQKVNIPASQYIFPNTFKGCTSLTELKAGKCKIVGNYALDGCTAFKEITLLSDQYGNSAPTKSNTSDGYVFQNCKSAEKITIDAKFLADFPNKTPNGFFNGCTNLSNIVTQNGDFSKVTVVSTKTFSGCAALTEMKFEDIRIVESDAFSNCTSLTRISADPNTPLNAEDYLKNAFLNCKNLKFAIQGNFSTIGEAAFKGSGVTAVNLEGMQGGTVVIGNNAFDSCENLTDATVLSDSAAKFSIGTSVFANCPNLKTATYEGKIITANMFKNCPLLEKVTTNAKTIKASAFDGDAKLTIVADKNDPANSIIADEINEYAFRNCAALKVLPANKNTVLKGASIFANCASIPKAEVGILTAGIFSGCSKLSDVTLENITSIPKSAFSGCTSLESIDIENMETIGANAFDGSGLKSVKLNGAQTVDTSAFANCANLAEIDVTADKINTKAFYNSGTADGVTQKASLAVNTIGANAFENCSTLNSVTIKSDDSHKLASLGASAFNNCKNLNTITINGNPTMGSKSVGFINNKVNTGFILVGDTGSTVNTYATNNNIKFRDASGFDPSTIVVPGDANCDDTVDMSDIVLIMQALASPNKYGTSGTDKNHITTRGIENADVFDRGSGMTNADALQIQKYLLKLIDKLS